MTLNHLFSTLKGGKGSGNIGHASVPGHRGGSAPSGMSSISQNIFGTENYQKVKATADKQIKVLADEYGITEEEYKNKLESKMKKELEGSEIKIRMSEKALNAVLKDEEIKNTFQTNKSSSAYRANRLTYAQYLETRDEIEKELWGNSPKAVYGFFEKKQGKNWQVEHYGDVSIVLKNEVKGRSTFTDADSLDFGRNRFIPSEVSKPSAYSSLYLTNSSDPLKIWKEGVDKVSPEVQIFGGVKLQDIARVHFEKPPSQKTIISLEQKGITWTTLS